MAPFSALQVANSGYSTVISITQELIIFLAKIKISNSINSNFENKLVILNLV